MSDDTCDVTTAITSGEAERRCIEAARKAAELVAADPTFGGDHSEDDFLATNVIDIRHEAGILWDYRIPATRHALLPSATSHCNPILLDDLVVAAVFSRGRIAAVDRATGLRRWNRLLPNYGNYPVTAHGRLFTASCRTLYSIDPANGRIRWEFTPADASREYIYSLPTIAQDRVFIGDRGGRFHCLQVDSGRLLWSVQTSTQTNSDVNATAVLHEGLVITATNARLVIAYDLLTGREAWRYVTDLIPDTLCFYRDMLLVNTTEILYGLDPRTGNVLHRWTWPEHEISFVAVAADILCVVITNEYCLRYEWKKVPNPKHDLVGLHGSTELWRRQYYRYAMATLRYEPRNGLIYEATSSGLGILDPKTGRRLAVIQGIEAKDRPLENKTGLPTIDADSLYVLTEYGLIARLKHPSTSDC